MRSSLARGATAMPDFERFDAIRELGAGGMASVYLARTKSSLGVARLVAVKCCHAHLLEDPRLSQMFVQEAIIASRIHHPNVVAVLEAGVDPVLHLVMEYVHGVTLSELKSRGPLPVPVALRIAVDVLEGLHAAHELEDENGVPMSVIHRDVSPRNLLVGADGLTRVTDFGIARVASQAARTRSGELRGTLAYMSPEQIDPEEIGLRPDALDRRADLFAVGIVLHEMLTGAPLFRRETEARTMRAILQGEVTPPSKTAAAVPPRLDDLVCACLSLRPDDRPDTARQVIALLGACGVPLASHEEVRAVVAPLLRPIEPIRAPMLVEAPRHAQAATITEEAGVSAAVDRTLLASPRTQTFSPAPTAGRPRRVPLGLFGLIAFFALGLGGLFAFRSIGRAPEVPPPDREPEAEARIVAPAPVPEVVVDRPAEPASEPIVEAPPLERPVVEVPGRRPRRGRSRETSTVPATAPPPVPSAPDPESDPAFTRLH